MITLSTRSVRSVWLFALSALLLFAAGCASVDRTADRILTPAKADSPGEWERYRGEVMIDVSPKPFQYFLVPAGEMDATIQFGTDPKQASSISFNNRLNPKGRSASARGTIVLLHGFRLDAFSTTFLQMMASTREFDALAIELRNHGGSPALPLGFGPEEGRDVVKMIDTLRAQQKLRDPLFFIGYSYGATTALYAAKALGPNVPVVAIAPFSQADVAVTQTLTWLKGESSFLSSAALPSKEDMPKVTAAVEKKLGIDLKHINTARAVNGMRNCVLLIGSPIDQAVPLAQVNEIRDALPRGMLREFVAPHNALMTFASINGFPLVEWLAASRETCAAMPTLAQPAETPRQ
jgi:pimeloyl-ACP methyl ester carboxylesterase